MSEEKLYNRAERKVDQRIGFYRHLFAFVFVNAILIIINVIYLHEGWWFYWVTVFWGIGLLGHFLRTFVFYQKLDEDYRDSMIEKEMEKMRK